MSGFVHLHLHSEYSLLDGACRIEDIPARVKGPIVLDELAALFAYAVRHYYDGFIALDCADEGETYPLIPACGFDDYGIGLEQSADFGLAYHVRGGARLDGTADVQGFEFHENLGHVGRGHAVESHQRSVAHCVKYGVADHGLSLSV